MMHRIIKRLSPVLGYLLMRYLSKPRPYKYKGIRIIVHPGVFYPGFIYSTRILLDWIEKEDLAGKKFLELGAGSGIISLVAARKGALVTASDINPVATASLVENSRENNIFVNCVHSDLFEQINEEHFDYIVIAPPYYPLDPKNMRERAWFCGKNFEYFNRLFDQLRSHCDEGTGVIMILSEDCNLDRISSIASENGFTLQEVHRKKRFWEWNFIYRILKIT